MGGGLLINNEVLHHLGRLIVKHAHIKFLHNFVTIQAESGIRENERIDVLFGFSLSQLKSASNLSSHYFRNGSFFHKSIQYVNALVFWITYANEVQKQLYFRYLTQASEEGEEAVNEWYQKCIQIN